MKIGYTCPACGFRGGATAGPDAWQDRTVTLECGGCARVLDQRGAVLCIEDHEMPIAVGFLALRGTEVLAVSRRNDHTAFGLPGGKVDAEDGSLLPDSRLDTLRRAVRRELGEETGVWVDVDDLIIVYQGVCPGGADGIAYWMITFGLLGPLPAEPATQPREGVVAWVPWETLTRGAFPTYNTRLRAAAG